MGYPGLQIAGTAKYHETIERWTRRVIRGDDELEVIYEALVAELEALTDSIGRENQLRNWRSYVDELLRPRSLYP